MCYIVCTDRGLLVSLSSLPILIPGSPWIQTTKCCDSEAEVIIGKNKIILIERNTDYTVVLLNAFLNRKLVYQLFPRCAVC